MVSKWAETFLGQLDLAGLVLIVMLIGMALLFLRAQAGDFDFKRMLVDDNEKPSMVRILAVGAWGVSSWVVMRDAVSVGGGDASILGIYLACWSGAPIAVKMIEAIQTKWSPK